MTRCPAALLLALLGPQDPAAPFRWKVDLNSGFTMQFSLHEQRRSNVVQKGVGTLGTTHQTSGILDEKREIHAELSYRELPGRPWSLAVALKKVTWTRVTEEAEIAVTLVEGKEPQARVSVRERDKLRIQTARMNAEQQAEHMKRLLTGEYDLVPERSGRVTFARAGAVDAGFSLFGRAFVQPPAPSEPLAAGLSWKEPLSPEWPGQSESGLTELCYRVASLDEKAVTVKGTAAGPLTRPSVPGTALNGSFALEREFVFSTDGHVQSSREEFSYRKTASRQEKFFGGTTTTEENVSVSLRQSLTLKPKRTGTGQNP